MSLVHAVDGSRGDELREPVAFIVDSKPTYPLL